MGIRVRVIKIGNSLGIRIPKFMLDQIAADQVVELELMKHQIVIRPARTVRQNWDALFQAMAQQSDDELLDSEVLSSTTWDVGQWEW